MVSRVFACSAFGGIPNFLRDIVAPEPGEAEAGPAHGRSFPCPEGGILPRGILCGGVAYGSDCALRHINLTLSLCQ
jgi:hypothetical protein